MALMLTDVTGSIILILNQQLFLVSVTAAHSFLPPSGHMAGNCRRPPSLGVIEMS